MGCLGKIGLETPNYGYILCPEVEKDEELSVGLGRHSCLVSHFPLPSCRIIIDFAAPSDNLCFLGGAREHSSIIKTILAAVQKTVLPSTSVHLSTQKP